MSIFFIFAVAFFTALESSAQSRCLQLFAKSQIARSECTEDFSSNGKIKRISCPCDKKSFAVNFIESRQVLYRLPSGPAPKKGFPVVFLFQGSYFPVEFSRTSDLPFGGFHEVRLIQKLLDHGFAVVAPRARFRLGWETNMPSMNGYHGTSDYKFMAMILKSIYEGEFGKLDPYSLYATGISSGGYHSSRMAIEFPDIFKAIAIHSASYATFLGPLTPSIPALPLNHPPTLFIHGAQDKIVPMDTTLPYIQKLYEAGVEQKMIESANEGHAWFSFSPDAITKWFLSHP